jgi:hypothetical protein
MSYRIKKDHQNYLRLLRNRTILIRFPEEMSDDNMQRVESFLSNWIQSIPFSHHVTISPTTTRRDMSDERGFFGPDVEDDPISIWS